MSGVRSFEPYQVRPSIAAVLREVDEATSELVALRRENTRLRAEKAEALCAAEAERVESARLRAENLKLSTALADARWSG
ncbi:hypothetical protein A5677_17060 [Mycobacterium malmoense]|uniref:Uncharacterized protein n=1 Tax=Mycobacterium malmoense TaxID=1780 RepID=A0A1B9DA87_MYCMA|nr:hypothetical protein [Mycobacterium malmoense]OCB57673.1 hypothetical protein A5677_17060 [Mycobacterium malmoense]